MISTKEDSSGKMRIEISGRGGELMDEFTRITEQIFKILGEDDCKIAFKAGTIAAKFGESEMNAYLERTFAEKEKEFKKRIDECSKDFRYEMLRKAIETADEIIKKRNRKKN